MLHRNARFAVAAVATAGLIGAATSTADAAPHHHRATSTAADASFKAVIKAHGKSSRLKLTGPTTVSAGPAQISLRSVGGEFELAVISFKGNYTMKDFKADLAAFGASYNKQGQPSKAGLAHLRHAIKHAHAYGGLDATAGEPDSGEFLLNRPGTAYVYNDSGNLPTQVHKITVTASSVTSALPSTKKTVTMLTDRRFGGAKTLPAKGTITVHNKSTESPHFLSLVHVKQGTTRKQILDFLESGSQSPPPFGLNGSTGTDALTFNESQTLTYSVPKGEYAELCFFPDPQTGMPHALMGMIRIVTLK